MSEAQPPETTPPPPALAGRSDLRLVNGVVMTTPDRAPNADDRAALVRALAMLLASSCAVPVEAETRPPPQASPTPPDPPDA